MDGQDDTAHHADASRPALGFPLGTALLLIVVFCLSGVFSCCYHWDKLQALRRSFSGPSDADADADADSIEAPAKPAPLPVDAKQSLNESLPVLMPGDRIPKYIAWPCPCEPPSRGEAMAVVVQTPPFRNA
ncbi:hypothetical protein ACLOJK_036157 [Asimina triloba]